MSIKRTLVTRSTRDRKTPVFACPTCDRPVTGRHRLCDKCSPVHNMCVQCKEPFPCEQKWVKRCEICHEQHLEATTRDESSESEEEDDDDEASSDDSIVDFIVDDDTKSNSSSDTYSDNDTDDDSDGDEDEQPADSWVHKVPTDVLDSLRLSWRRSWWLICNDYDRKILNDAERAAANMTVLKT